MKKYFEQGRKPISIILALILLLLGVTGCGNSSDLPEEEVQGDSRVIKDMAGREVEIPSQINKVFTTGSVGTIALYSVNPSLIAGLNSEVDELEKKYLSKEYLELPVLGRYDGIDSGNEEEILSIGPDIILSMGNVDEKWVSEADESQEKLGIPFIMIDSDLEKIGDTYEFLGDILGEEERCKLLADYSRETIEGAIEIGKTIPEDEKVSIYYASTQSPLSTNVAGSIHTQTMDYIGAKNAAEVVVEKMSAGVEVSMEQILNWNPDFIIATKASKGDEGSYEKISKDSSWDPIKAVEDGKIYAIPNAPFSWFDRPPSINRIIGIKWLGNLVYPEYFDMDIGEETKEFYELFYHRALTDEEVKEILEDAMGS